jgi:hypothetical protein
MLPHPEGGYFKETYRSKEEINAMRYPLDLTGIGLFQLSLFFIRKRKFFSFSSNPK